MLTLLNVSLPYVPWVKSVFSDPKMKVGILFVNTETCRVLADRLLAQGNKVALACIDCFEVEVARQIINELQIAGKQQGEHIKILIVKTPT